MKAFVCFASSLLLLIGCTLQESKVSASEVTYTSADKASTDSPPFLWENASIYFLLIDRFYNAIPENDAMYGRHEETGLLRGFKGGDIAGVTKKIRQGYFNNLGVDAIWVTPHIQQIPDRTDEGTGLTYAYHGYWALDWTTMDANFGTMDEMKEFVRTAHEHGIRVLMDIVINQTGPVTEGAPQWPDEWVRTGPPCTFQNKKTTVTCTLVENLPDIRTESDEPVELPPMLVEKWKAEGRYEQEVAELDAFFERTGLPRSPRHYIMKWHLDWIRKLGVDGVRVDTVKHTEPYVWAEFRALAEKAHAEWKADNPDRVALIGDNPFYMLGEVYNYALQHGQVFDMGGGDKVNFFNYGFDSLVSFSLKNDAHNHYETIFSTYSNALNGGELEGLSVVHYVSTHDDGYPFDPKRERPFEAGTKLMLSPGAVQIYYGDETARDLVIPGTVGDATLRSFMNWDELEANAEKNGYRVADVLAHWQKLGLFRQANVAVGAGVHQKIQAEPYIFKRTYDKDGLSNAVVVGLDLPEGPVDFPVKGVFHDGETLTDYYSGNTAKVIDGRVVFDTQYDLVLIAR